jgi:aminotransferase
MGYACAPPVLIEAMMKIHQYSMLCAPILSQEASVEALKNGDNDVAEMREAYDLRRRYIHTSLNDMGLPCHLPGGAFYAFPYIGDTGLTSHDFSMRLLEEENVACVPGTAFGPSGEGYLRCSYAAAMDEIEQAMERMQRFVSRL